MAKMVDYCPSTLCSLKSVSADWLIPSKHCHALRLSDFNKGITYFTYLLTYFQSRDPGIGNFSIPGLRK